MKSILFVVLMLLFVHTETIGQITVNENNLVGVFEIVKRSHDDMPSASVTIGNAGASQTWDYSSILVESAADTMVFTDPSLLPGAAMYPTANLALVDEQDSSYMFLDKNSNGLFVLGQSFYDQGQLIIFEYPTTIITLPATMGTAYTNTANIDLYSFPLGVDPDGPAGPHGTVDSVKVVRTIEEISAVDAWGQLTTPLGTFATIRQNMTNVNTDSTWQFVNGSWEILSPEMEIITGQSAVLTITNYSVLWWSDDPAARFPVLEMSHDNAGTVMSAAWLKETPTAALNTDVLNEIRVYPNPASEKLTIDAAIAEARSYAICNVLGSVISKGDIVNNTAVIELSSFNQGVYFVCLYDNNEELLYQEKFIVGIENE